jgi:three-Cys-motif partner protein
MESVEIFLNFPTLDINRNALVVDPSKAKPEHIRRMNRFWGDDSWRRIAYSLDELSGLEIKKWASRSLLATAFRERLRNVAGFAHVPEPVVMKTKVTRGPVLYYLFFASYNTVGNKIVSYIFDKYRAREGYTLF